MPTSGPQACGSTAERAARRRGPARTVRVGVLPRILQPRGEVVEGLPPAGSGAAGVGPARGWRMTQPAAFPQLPATACSAPAAATPRNRGIPRFPRRARSRLLPLPPRRRFSSAYWRRRRRRHRRRPSPNAHGARCPGARSARAPQAPAPSRSPGDVVDQQRAGGAAVVRPRDGAEGLLAGLEGRGFGGGGGRWQVRARVGRRRGGARRRFVPRSSTGFPAPWALPAPRTVSQICSLICFWSMLIMRAPNSTPMVRSCTGWKRLSVNCRSRQDLPTPEVVRQGARLGRAQGRCSRARDPDGAGVKRSGTPRALRPSTSLTCVANDDVFEKVPACIARGPCGRGARSHQLARAQALPQLTRKT